MIITRESKGAKTKIKAWMAIWIYIMFIAFPPIGFYLLFCGCTVLRVLMVAMLLYQYLFARRLMFLRRLANFLQPMNYFPSSVVEFEEKPENMKKTLFPYHPHGVFSQGLLINYLQERVFDDFVVCGSRAAAYTPFMGFFVIVSGIVGANPENFKALMKKGQNFFFVPGGFEESTLTKYGEERLYLKNRKGFIKYALQYGYKICPVYTFNETKLYKTVQGFEKLGLFLNKLKIPGVIFYSNLFFLPYNSVHLHTVFGKPLEIPQIDNPSNEDIDKYHSIYVEHLKDLFNRHKGKLGAKDLEIS